MLMSWTRALSLDPTFWMLPSSTVRHPQLFPDITDVLFFALEEKDRRPRRFKPADIAELSYDFVGNPIAEPLLVFLGAHIDEGQNGN